MKIRDDPMDWAATTAMAPADKRRMFGALLNKAVAAALRNHNGGQLRQPRKKVVGDLEKARDALKNLLPEHKGAHAGTIFMASIAHGGDWIDIEDLVDQFDIAIYNATCNPKTAPPGAGRPKGATHAPFDALLTDLLMMEVHCGFRWKCHAAARQL
jgi:hypothetical protein